MLQSNGCVAVQRGDLCDGMLGRNGSAPTRLAAARLLADRHRLRSRMVRLRERPAIHMALSPAVRGPRCGFGGGATFPDVESLRRMAASPALQRPRCETGLSQFCLLGKTRYSKRCRRFARANGRKLRRTQTAKESLGGFSVAKSRTVGLNSESQRPEGRRLNIPGWQREIRTMLVFFVAVQKFLLISV